MTQRHGLTLLEVLAATVLLTMIAAVCTPLLRQAIRHLHEPDATVLIFDLAQFADGLVADPSEFDVESVQSVTGELQLPWLQHPDRPAVIVRRLNAIDPNTDHAWLSFTCGNNTVFRWIALEVDQPREFPP